MRGKFVFGAASAAIVAALGFSSGASAQTADPAGDASTEARLTPGETVNGALDPASDRDWFRLSVTPGHRYAISLDSAAATGEPGGFDTLLVLYGANGVEIMRNDDANQTLNSALVYRPTEAGDVFVEARGYADDATGQYVLNATESIVPPDDVGGDASTSGRLTPGQAASGRIEEESDEDWYRLSARTGQIYRLSLASAEGASEPLGDPLLRIIGREGEELASNDDSDGTLNSALEFVPRANGDVYVVAGGFGGSMGAYTLNAEASRLPPDDAGNDVGSRTRLAIGQSAGGALNYAGDHDWYRVRLEQGQAYRFRLDSVEGAFDPFVSLHDASGEELAVDDDGGDALNSYLEFAAPRTGDYFVEVRGFSEEAQGAYTLSAAAGDIPSDASTDASLSAEGDYREGVLAPEGDADWYRVDLTEGQSLRIALNTADGNDGLADPFLVLYGPDGAEAARDDDGGEGLSAWLEYTATAAGAHYVEVRGFSAESAAGRYVVTVTAGEIGDTMETADHLVANAEGRASRIGAPSDADWFAIELIEGRPYRIHADSTDGALDPMLRLIDGQGVEIRSDDDGGQGLNGRIDFTSATGGSYFVAVSAFGETFGSYLLRIADTDVAGNAGTDEYLDPTGDERQSRIEMAGDLDFYGAELQQGVRYEIRVSGEGDDPLADAFLTVSNTAGETVTSDDDSGEGLDARLVFTPETTDMYFIQASGLGGSTGGYRVSLTPQAPRE